MKNIALLIVVITILVSINGCATPRGKTWYRENTAEDTIKSDVSGCKSSTFMWWPFDTLNKCMHRRGYHLVTLEDYKQKKNEIKSDNIKKLEELKKMKDNGLISEKEYEDKKVEILSQY